MILRVTVPGIGVVISLEGISLLMGMSWAQKIAQALFNQNDNYMTTGIILLFIGLLWIVGAIKLKLY